MRMSGYGSSRRKTTRGLPHWGWVVLIIIYVISLSQAPAIDQIYIRHVVEEGDTLWSIALQYRPDVDPREIIYQIRKINEVTPLIREGQVLLVPVR